MGLGQAGPGGVPLGKSVPVALPLSELDPVLLADAPSVTDAVGEALSAHRGACRKGAGCSNGTRARATLGVLDPVCDKAAVG